MPSTGRSGNFSHNKEALLRVVQWLACLALVLFPARSWADFFVFNATTNPMTGTYIPVGGGHEESEGFESETVSDATSFFGGITDVEVGNFSFSQGYVPENPTSPLPCVTLKTGYCFNNPQFFSADNGTPVPGDVPYGLAIYDSAGNPRALMEGGCTADAICDMTFFAGIGGAAIDLSTQPAFLQNAFADSYRIVATGGIQDAIDADFYDGSVDSFEFILTTPEPTSLIFLGTVLAGLGVGIFRRHRYRRA
jgi:hypothetical protein